MAVTMAGACGDSGMDSPHFVLWLSGRSREAVLASEEIFLAARRSREVLRAVPCTTISQSAFFMPMHCGLDNRFVLPPFLPVLRNADGIFGQLLRAARPEGSVAHLPSAVLHLPGEPRAFPEDRSFQPRLADLILLLARSLSPAPWLPDPEQRLLAIGGGLVQAGRLRPSAFAGLMRELWASEISRHIMALERLLDRFEDTPEYWAQGAEAWIEEARRHLTGGEALVPELAGRSAGAEGPALAQRVVRAYGELLLAWPSLRAASAELVRSGLPLALPR